MQYNFDEVIDRKNTGSSKHDSAVDNGMPEDISAFWVADMDFRVPQPVIEALVRRSEHGIFGYTRPGDDYFPCVQNWYKERFGYEFQKEWLVFTPGIVFATAMAVRSFTEPGDGVLIQRPVYYPFSNVIVDNVIVDNGRRIVNSPLVYQDGVYTVDYGDFEKKIVEEKIRLFILCNPHNPVGRVWTRDELERMGDICLKHGVTIVSDEIHSDFIWPGNQHTVFVSIKPEYEEVTMTCTAPSKTFNLAGLQISHIFLKNPQMRERFAKEVFATGYEEPSMMGVAAAQAAYESGGEWLEQLKEYLVENIELTRGFLKEHLPKVKLVEPQGTYLLWLDYNELGFSKEELKERIVNRAKLWFDHGTMFGEEGLGFNRINMACPRSVLKDALERMAKALNE